MEFASDTLEKFNRALKTKIEQLRDTYSQYSSTFLNVKDIQTDMIEDLKKELKNAQQKLKEMEHDLSLYTNLPESDLSSNEKMFILSKQMYNVCDPSESEDIRDVVVNACTFYENVALNERCRDIEQRELQNALDKTKNQIEEYKNIIETSSSSPKELEKLIALKKKQLKQMTSSSHSQVSKSESIFDLTGKTFGNKRNQLMELCRKRLEPYHVTIHDFSFSWSDGKAFLALIHSFRPELFDFESIKENTDGQNFLFARALAVELGIQPNDFNFCYLIKNGILEFIKVIELVEKIIILLQD